MSSKVNVHSDCTVQLKRFFTSDDVAKYQAKFFMRYPPSPLCVTTVNQTWCISSKQHISEAGGCTAFRCTTHAYRTSSLDSKPRLGASTCVDFSAVERQLPNAWHSSPPTWLLLGFMPPGVCLSLWWKNNSSYRNQCHSHQIWNLPSSDS